MVVTGRTFLQAKRSEDHFLTTAYLQTSLGVLVSLDKLIKIFRILSDSDVHKTNVKENLVVNSVLFLFCTGGLHHTN